MALLLMLVLAAAVRGQQTASTPPPSPGGSSDRPATNLTEEDASITRTTPPLVDTTSGLLKTDQGTPKNDESPSSFTSSLTANNVNSISIIDTRYSSTERVELVTPFGEYSTSGSSAATTEPPSNLSKDSSTSNPSTVSDTPNEIVSRYEAATIETKTPSSTTLRPPTPPEPTVWTTLRDIMTTSRPLDSRSSVAAVVATSTLRSVASTFDQESGMSSTVKPVAYPDAYAGNSGLDIESSGQGDTDVSSARPSTTRRVVKPQRTVITTKPVSRVGADSQTTPRSQVVSAASNYAQSSEQQPDPKNKVSGKRKTGGIKIKKTKKKDNGMSSLLYIPIMIQAQLIPMMLMNLKFMALKALTLGKLALLILGLNLLRNAMLGYNNDAEQYEQETLASQHYGYSGSPEYGSWINRRMYTLPQDSKAGQSYKPQFMKSGITASQGNTGLSNRSQKINNIQSTTYIPEIDVNHPYRAYRSKGIMVNK